MKTLTKIMAVLSLISFLAVGCKPKSEGMSEGTEVEQDSAMTVPADSSLNQSDSSAVH